MKNRVLGDGNYLYDHIESFRVYFLYLYPVQKKLTTEFSYNELLAEHLTAGPSAVKLESAQA